MKDQPDRHLHLSAVTIGELQAGLEMTRERNLPKAGEIEAWIDLVAATYNVLPMDTSTFRMWARLTHRRSDSLMMDAMIAATAAIHDLTVVTRNVRDFETFPIRLLDPFSREP